MYDSESYTERYYVNAMAGASYEIVKGLKADFQVGADISFDEGKSWSGEYLSNGKPSASKYTNKAITVQTTTQLSYDRTFGKHSVNAVAAMETQNYQLETLSGSASELKFPNLKYDNLAKAGSTTVGSGYTMWSLMSFIGRVNYSFDGRYMASVSVRHDGSSKFADGNQWGTFPSVSGAWRISNESFFPKDGIISDLKLCASWGMTGNQEGIGNYDSRSLANGGHNYNGQDGIAITTLANPDLKWEKSDQTNIGLNLSLFNDRVTVGMDYFIKNTKDLLYDRPLHTTTGFSSITQNIGSMRNTGFEFNVESHNIMNDRFSWDTQFNISTIKNKLTSLIDEKPIPVGNHVLQVGQPIGSFYMYKMDGIYQDNQEVPEKLYAKGVRAGDIKYADKDNDGDLTPADKEIVGKPLPDFFGGLTNRFRYGNFDLTIFNTFSVGNDVYATGMGGIDAVGHNNYGMRKDIAANRWTGPGTNNSIPRAMISTHNTQASTYLLHDGSYFKFKDVTLGYTLPSNLTQKLNISNMRVYLSAQNLWTISSYPGYDPEVSYSVNNSKTMGEDAMTVPQLRTFVCGFNLTF